MAFAFEARRDESLIQLARAEPFRLGSLVVNPATREVSRDGESEILEPRVMQVLVALFEAKGAVVSRDELVARCWDGRIVGDNAITRVIVQLRRLANEFGQSSFELETITKVGYRLVVREGAAVATSPEASSVVVAEPRHRSFSRRAVVGAGLAAGCAATAWFGWKAFQGHEPPPEAVELFKRGEHAQRQGLPDLSRQAVVYLEQAVAIDPFYSAAWGSLALAYRHLLEAFGEAEYTSLPERIRSAAGRALALDPRNADARLALILVHPFYGNWRQMEASLRELGQEHPDHWLLRAQTGLLLYEVGRIEEGIPHSQHVLEIDPFLPVGHMFLARALSMAGRLQEAEAVLNRGGERWPAHPALWGTRYSFLLFNGRPAAAAAFAMDPDSLPSGMPRQAVKRRVRIARAFETREPGLVAEVIASARAEAAADPKNAQFATAILALLGLKDDVFQILHRYYFQLERPLGRYERRYTYSLFAPALREVREDARFPALLDRIGLTRYWRETGTKPDYALS